MLKQLTTPPGTDRRRDRDTARTRRQAYRWRQKNGRLALRIDVDDTALPAVLIELGYLRRDQEDDKKSLQNATVQVLDALAHGLILWRR